MIAARSAAAVGAALTERTAMSFSSASVVARRFGVVRPLRVTSTIAFGSSVHAPHTPRGRWYLKLRPTMRTPFANKAEAMLSPTKPA